MLFSAELPWCLVFVQKINFREKSRKIYQRSYFSSRPMEPEGEERKAPESARQDPDAGVGLAAPGWRLAASGTFSASPFAYMTYVTRNTKGVRSFSQNKSTAPPPQKNPTLGTRNSVLLPCQDGETEEIISIIITN